MPKKNAKRTVRQNRMDAAEHGIDLPAVLESIKPHLAGMTQAEIGEACGVSTMAVSHLMTGFRNPSIGMLAALAKAAGGTLEVRFQPPKAKRQGNG